MNIFTFPFRFCLLKFRWPAALIQESVDLIMLVAVGMLCVVPQAFCFPPLTCAPHDKHAQCTIFPPATSQCAMLLAFNNMKYKAIQTIVTWCVVAEDNTG